MGYLDNSGLAYFWGKVKALINAKAPTSHASTATTYGVANASKYGHAKASGTTPKALGTAAVGSETAAFARGDHIHPMPTAEQVGALPVNGTAANASKLGGKLPGEYATMEIRWLNASPTSSFSEQEISVPLDDVGSNDIIAIEVRRHIGVGTSMLYFSRPYTDGMAQLLDITMPNDSYYKFESVSRTSFVYKGSNRIVFEDCKKVSYVDAPSVDNNCIIPVAVYVIKGVTA